MFHSVVTKSQMWSWKNVNFQEKFSLFTKCLTFCSQKMKVKMLGYCLPTDIWYGQRSFPKLSTDLTRWEGEFENIWTRNCFIPNCRTLPFHGWIFSLRPRCVAYASIVWWPGPDILIFGFQPSTLTFKKQPLILKDVEVVVDTVESRQGHFT